SSRSSDGYGWSIDGPSAVALRMPGRYRCRRGRRCARGGGYGEAAITARGDVREAPVTTGRPCRRGTCDGAPMSARRPLRRSGGCGEAAVTARWRLRRGGAYSELTRWAMADFLLAAWLR